jgi:hypothetical protein
MSFISKKDVDILLRAGFAEEDLGLTPKTRQGVEIYETPDDYFARELIENACEQGECDLMDEILPYIDEREHYDDSHKALYADDEYPGNDDPADDCDPNLRQQIEWLKTIRIGKINIWQKRSEEGGFEFPVSELRVLIPPAEKERMNKLSPENKKLLWSSYAKEEWRKCWQAAVDSLYDIPIEDRVTIYTKKGLELNVIVISADNLREIGYDNLPYEARWITMIFWEKE